MGYVLRVLLPVLEYWICGQMLARGIIVAYEHWQFVCKAPVFMYWR